MSMYVKRSSCTLVQQNMYGRWHGIPVQLQCTLNRLWVVNIDLLMVGWRPTTPQTMPSLGYRNTWTNNWELCLRKWVTNHLTSLHSPAIVLCMYQESPKYACVVSVGCGVYPPDPIGDFNIQKFMTLNKESVKFFNSIGVLLNLLKLLGNAVSMSEVAEVYCDGIYMW